MRRFLFVSHTVPPDGAWGLDDLAGAAGRVDVLCRNVQTALFLSHALRRSTEVWLAFLAEPDRPTAVRIRGADLLGLHPDERSVAGVIRNALRARHDDPWWATVQPGLDVAPFGLADLAREAREALATPVLLDKNGDDLREAYLPKDPFFILGDHAPLAEAERKMFKGARTVSLGPVWYHGHMVAAILQYTLDRGEGAS